MYNFDIAPLLKLSFDPIFSKLDLNDLVTALFWLSLIKLLGWRYLKKYFLSISYLRLISSNYIMLSVLGKNISWIFSNPFDAHVLNTTSALPGVKHWFPHMGLYCDNIPGPLIFFFYFKIHLYHIFNNWICSLFHQIWQCIWI